MAILTISPIYLDLDKEPNSSPYKRYVIKLSSVLEPSSKDERGKHIPEHIDGFSYDMKVSVILSSNQSPVPVTLIDMQHDYHKRWLSKPDNYVNVNLHSKISSSENSYQWSLWALRNRESDTDFSILYGPIDPGSVFCIVTIDIGRITPPPPQESPNPEDRKVELTFSVSNARIFFDDPTQNKELEGKELTVVSNSISFEY